jgi:hypothetical protein
MKKTDTQTKTGFSKKKKQHDISKDEIARAVANFKNEGGKITVIKHPQKAE